MTVIQLTSAQKKTVAVLCIAAVLIIAFAVLFIMSDKSGIEQEYESGLTAPERTTEATTIPSCPVLDDVEPKAPTAAPPGTMIQIAALAPSGAKVTAQIGDETVELEESDVVCFTQQSDYADASTFLGIYTMANSDKSKDLGNYTVTSEYNGQTATLQGGDMTIVADIVSYARIAQIQADAGYTSLYPDASLLTPYTNHGLGKTVMCEVLRDHAEVTSAVLGEDKSDPLYTPLLKGCFDTVTGVTNIGGNQIYILGSGRKIYASYCKFIPSAYVMPSNSVSLLDAFDDGDSVEIRIKTDRIVPTAVQLQPQGYYTGYDSRRYNVNALECEYLDLTLFDTASCSGAPQIPQTGAVSYSEWLTDGGTRTILRVHLKNKGGFYGYAINYSGNGIITLSINSKPSGVRTVMLDPGHGGPSDSGTYSAFPDIYEKSVNLSIAQTVSSILISRGYNVLLTRNDDSLVTLNQRNLDARTQVPDIFVSLHCDGVDSSSETGTHSFYYTSWSMPLAKAIHRRLRYMYQTTYPANDYRYSKIDKGVHFWPYQVARIEECPAVLIECGYLTNRDECAFIVSQSGISAIAEAVANGIDDYFASLG